MVVLSCLVHHGRGPGSLALRLIRFLLFLLFTYLFFVFFLHGGFFKTLNLWLWNLLADEWSARMIVL